MRRIWYLKEEKERDIKAVKLFLYEKNGCICGKMDLSAFREKADKSKEDILLMMKNEDNLEIGTVNLSEETAAKEAYLCGKGRLKEELARRIAMEKDEIYLSVMIGTDRYLSDGWKEEIIEDKTAGGVEKQEAVTGGKPEELPETDTIEEMEQLPELEAEELLEEETAGRRIVQLSTLEEELLFREYIHNSFLLHGYYNYGHIMIDETEEEPRLGVPGNYYEREQMVAAMFGFPDFEPAREEEKTSNGTFGYYYTRRKR